MSRVEIYADHAWLPEGQSFDSMISDLERRIERWMTRRHWEGLWMISLDRQSRE
jgi:hypothetical protein